MFSIVGGATVVIGFKNYALNFNESPQVNTHYVFHNFSDGNYSPATKDNDGQFKYSETIEVVLIPTEITLFQNYPNSFNPSTKIRR